MEIYGEKAIRNLEFQIQTKRILQIFDEMITKLEILLCLQEMLKQDEIMMQQFSADDLDAFRRVATADAESLVIDDSTKQLIRVLLNSNNMQVHVDHIKDNVRIFQIFILYLWWKSSSSASRVMIGTLWLCSSLFLLFFP